MYQIMVPDIDECNGVMEALVEEWKSLEGEKLGPGDNKRDQAFE